MAILSRPPARPCGNVLPAEHADNCPSLADERIRGTRDVVSPDWAEALEARELSALRTRHKRKQSLAPVDSNEDTRAASLGRRSIATSINDRTATPTQWRHP